jgi:hypothetical protein
VRPQARRPVVRPARRDRGLVKGVDGGAVLGAERHVDVRLLRRALIYPEVGLRRHAHPDHHHAARELDRHLHQDLVAERRQRLLVEAPRAHRIADADPRVIDHGATSSTGARDHQ